MTYVELLDTLWLCAASRKGWRQTASTIKVFWSMIGRAKRGDTSGYRFAGYEFSCINPRDLSFLYSEIFLSEPYRFDSKKPNPLIIDGGVNIGMSVAYFKSIFPDSRIVGFEPHPQAYAVAKDNIERNRFDNVTLVNAALSGASGTIKLHYISNEIMASTVGGRLHARGLTPDSVEIPAVTLSKYLVEDADFLKLDIEGAEYAVLAEVGDRLRLVRNMFVEFHLTRGDGNNKLPEMLRLLEDAGFNYLITSTAFSRKTASVAPLGEVGPVSSLLVLARRVD